MGSVMFPYRGTRSMHGFAGPAPLGTTATVASFGEITASSLASIVTAKTGIRTTKEQILNRAINAGMAPPGWDTSTPFGRLEGAIAALATTYFDGSEPTASASRLIPLIEAFGQDKLVQAIDAINTIGLSDTFQNIGGAMIGRMVQPIADLISDVVDAVGGAGAFAAIAAQVAAAVGKAASEMGSMVPVIGGFYKLVSLGVNWINSRLFIAGGTTVSVDVFKKEPLTLYLYLCSKMGTSLPEAASWQAEYNPFFQETFISNIRMTHPMKGGVFSAVRAMDIGQYSVAGVRCPDWRTVFGSEAAMSYVRGDFEGQKDMPNHDADQVRGCDCLTLGSGAGDGVPWVRFNRDKDFRAAAVAACFINANVGCMKGIGQWDGSVRAYMDRGTREYDLGYGPDTERTTWWARLREDRIEVAPPVPNPWWDDYLVEMRDLAPYSYRDSDGVTHTVTGEGNVNLVREAGQQRCVVPYRSSRDTAWRTRLGAWKDATAWVPMLSATRSRYCPKSTPRITIRATEMRPRFVSQESSGISPVVVAGGLGAAGIALWLLLK